MDRKPQRTKKVPGATTSLMLLVCLLSRATLADATITPSIAEATQQIEAGHYQTALDVLTRLIAATNGKGSLGEAYYRMGQCYARLNRDNDALLAFYTAAYKYPDSATADEALMGMLGPLRKSGQTALALNTCERLVRRYPGSPHAAYALTCTGWLHKQMGNSQKAAAALAQVGRQYPDSPYAATAAASMSTLGLSTPPVRNPPSSVSPPASDTLPLIQAAPGTPFDVRTACRTPVEFLAGPTPDPATARLHVRFISPQNIAIHFENRWVTVGAQNVYGDQLTLIKTRREGNSVTWTFRHDLPTGSRTMFYIKNGKKWTPIAAIVST